MNATNTTSNIPADVFCEVAHDIQSLRTNLALLFKHLPDDELDSTDVIRLRHIRKLLRAAYSLAVVSDKELPYEQHTVANNLLRLADELSPRDDFEL